MKLNNRNFEIILFAHNYVGQKIIEFFIEKYRDDLLSVVLVKGNSKSYQYLIINDFPKERIHFIDKVYQSNFISFLKQHDKAQVILAWWPFIVKEPVLSIPQKGIINFHPSYLPYNRGKNANFWSIVEETPYGVSLQIIDESIDGGNIIFQKKIEKKWTDAGKSLYQKSREEIINLFTSNYLKIKEGKFKRIKQDTKQGTFHFRKELEPASEIFLDKKYIAKDLINLLRARTFPPHPACYFYNNGKKYEIRIEIIEIKELRNGSD